MNVKRKWLAVGLCGLWAALIFATSSTVITPRAFFNWFRAYVFQDPSQLERFRFVWASCWIVVVKGWHVTEFAILTWLATRGIDQLTGTRSRDNLLWAALACLAYAAADEWHQTFVPGRGGRFTDVAIDALGITLAVMLMRGGRERPGETSARESS